MASTFKHLAHARKQGSPDASALVRGIDEERPDRAIRHVAGAESAETVLIPDPDAAALDEIDVVIERDGTRIAEPILTNGARISIMRGISARVARRRW